MDGTIEKGLGPTDTLVQTGNPYEFQPYTMKILKTNKQKADWQDNHSFSKNLAERGQEAHEYGAELLRPQFAGI